MTYASTETPQPYALVSINGRFPYPAKKAANPRRTPATDQLAAELPELLEALRDARYNRLVPDASTQVRLDPQTRSAYCGNTGGILLLELAPQPQGIEADARDLLDAMLSRRN
ncbi:hypothetical protein IHN63_00045 [Deinococcus sp. 6YEL10]|uniref:hypothetical protein n=1 Tax=Deinococcus sp. 6YEL10 TaxID=2745870 RepID=UPI001E467331|nr:hypothetical protein [Deinococcus sp. 6YEL10]MCD0159688.1 hypothetical protein [Deinococcus sp. 6YEL10]